MKKAIPYFVIVIGALLLSLGFRLFLIPHQLLSGGASGISMIVGYHFDLNISIVYFFVNLPILIWGWFLIGRKFIVLSILSVVLTTWFLELLPSVEMIQEPIIASIFGGVLIGVGTGISLRVGGSTGGIDIVGSILTRNRDFPLGTMLFFLNALIVVTQGYPNQWDLALSSMLSIYVTGKIVDTIHIRHIKVTAFIITNHTEQLLSELLQRPRGVTILKTTGAYSDDEKDMLMTVTTRYELADLRKIIDEIDPKAFVNIVETVGVIGEFNKIK